ncbi:hypothetical protein [Acaryochloris thomasi]|nr:hypothetical protein [Acaryochloris thomasi]
MSKQRGQVGDAIATQNPPDDLYLIVQVSSRTIYIVGKRWPAQG